MNRVIREIGKYLITSTIFEYLEISLGIFRYLQASSDICRHLQISAGIFRYPQASSDIRRHLQISAGIPRCEPHINKILTSHIEFTESLTAPPGTHEACRLLQSLAYKAQVCLILTWPGRTESLPAICGPTWPLANTGLMSGTRRSEFFPKTQNDTSSRWVGMVLPGKDTHHP